MEKELPDRSASKDKETLVLLSKEKLAYDTKVKSLNLILHRTRHPEHRDAQIGSIEGVIHYKNSGTDEKGKIYEFPDTLEITDFTVTQEENMGRGYGSAMLSCLIDFAKHLGIRTITGKYSFVDNTRSNFQRRSAIYKKFGFTVTDNKIRLTLQQTRQTRADENTHQ